MLPPKNKDSDTHGDCPLTASTADDDQQEVIDIDSGCHLVLAPPGCGKTFILAERIIKAHNSGVNYDDMLCLTFTNRASRNMRDRVSERTGNPVPPNLFVGNVHRFCSQYLFDQKKIPQNSAIIDDQDVESIIASIASIDPGDHRQDIGETVNLQHALSQQRMGFPRELIVHADLLDRADDPRIKRMTRLALEYAKYKETDNLLDFEDLLEKTYMTALMEKEPVKRYKWIQVDEVQDLNLLQLAIIDLFSADNSTTVYLGDEQQAIFSFVGAKLDTLRELRRRCEGHIHHLGTNHRSPRYLLNLFNIYAERQLHISPDLLPNTADTTAAAVGDLCLFRACHHILDNRTANMQACMTSNIQNCGQCTSYIADEYRLATCLAKRYMEIDKEGRVAIIVPTNSNAERVSRTLGNTPHFKISGLDLFSTPPVQTVLSHLNVVANETCFIAWARLLSLLKVVDGYTQARDFMRQLRNLAISPTDMLLYSGTDTYVQHFLDVCRHGEIVIFDTETTGLDIHSDDIIQIAAIKIRDGKIVENSEFEVILETDKPLPPVVGGHENPMIAVYNNASRLSRTEGLQRFLDYCGGLPLLGHNVEYDYNILHNNLQREQLSADELSTVRFDSLKLARLLEPRLRVYKLEKLLDTLHLQGSNSHNAIDDVKATFSLVLYCLRKAEIIAPAQRQCLAGAKLSDIRRRLCQRYKPLYTHSTERLHRRLQPGDTPAIVQEMQYCYGTLLDAGLIQPCDKWNHIIGYLTTDIIQSEPYPSLKEQLDKYLVDINTSRESDLCDSTAMRQGDNRVRLFVTTAHKAKGLEFDNVIVFNASDSYYPFFNNTLSGDSERIAEDARRLYVALSRAKRRLCITYAATSTAGRPSNPSPFLDAIADMLPTYAINPATGKVEIIVTHQQ